jgi:hypothetical protein
MEVVVDVDWTEMDGRRRAGRRNTCISNIQLVCYNSFRVAKIQAKTTTLCLININMNNTISP